MRHQAVQTTVAGRVCLTLRNVQTWMGKEPTDLVAIAPTLEKAKRRLQILVNGPTDRVLVEV